MNNNFELSNFEKTRLINLQTVMQFSDLTIQSLAKKSEKSLVTVIKYKKNYIKGRRSLLKNLFFIRIEITFMPENTQNEEIKKLAEDYNNKNSSLSDGKSSTDSYLSLFLYNEKINSNISYSQFHKRLIKLGVTSAFAYKSEQKFCKKYVKYAKLTNKEYLFDNMVFKNLRKRSN
ncbi:hypothetical protein ACR82Z_02270 [Mycoplasma sp. 6243]|uniref:hypothetical protein n=1 Tax=Mycoplasma sp. 6243 TaxID=3440865 RepID=UPI003EBF413F